ncbi:uncharacterized protein DDB_G0283697-like [Odontomachus brunneus]|uniref:uncharacterized protein DDB_G0283697-like n=1 Tax=Odontomachus brunneus TaxID=486640 RepID=UPI0013F21B40|nr:uncharacterized protein DDB_G0283697-like [Odontomachus brunneus]
MRSQTRILILCLLCVVRASKVLSEEMTEFGKRTSIQNKDLRDLTRENDGGNEPDAGKFRDKRALGLLLSGLAQIFGFTATPIQFASLANPNMTASAAMSNFTEMGNVTKQLIASSRPMSTNATAPRQETIRFTGVVNFGNNSDIVGHLQRYEQIFHGRSNNTRPMTMTTSQPATSMPKPIVSLSIDPRLNLPTKTPLLTPFFVKIPLPIAPDLLPITTTPTENLKLSYPASLVTITSEPSEEVPPKTQLQQQLGLPIRKEQEMVYRNNGNIERYMVENKEIHNEKDVMKPVSKYTHHLYVDEPTLSKQQDNEERYNEVQRKQEEHVARIKEEEAQRNRDRDDYEQVDEINERHRNREEEIANRNQNHASKHDYSASEEKRPAYEDKEDEVSAERYEERTDQANRSNESSERPTEEDEREKTERYPDYDDNDEPSKQSGEYKQDDDQPPPVNLEKYIEVVYNQQLPIGDYFHESNPEQIRDSYGEVLNNKKLEDDRLSGYFSMFKHPYVDELDYQRNPEDASQEDKRKEISTANIYDEHLKRIQKLREEYALPVPESKYEEYEINDEDEANRNGRQNERDQNRNAAKSKKPKAGSVHGKEDVRAKTTSGSSKNQLQRESEEANSQKELDLVKYTPLIVPIRYIDGSDRVEQASTRQLKYKKSEKKSNNSQVPTADNVDLTTKEKPTLQIASLPERPRQLHEGEYKEFQLWPPPFDYAFDNTERTNTIVSANPQNYPLNYYQNIITNIADNDANNDNSSNQPAGYLVVVGNPVHPYRYPNNVYYFPKEAVNPQNQEHHLNAEGTHSQLYVSRQNADQQSTQVNPNPTEYNYNGSSTKGSRDYYYQPQQATADVSNPYRYAFRGYASESRKLPNVDARNQISNTENWSNRIYSSQPRSDRVVNQLPPTLAQLQNIASSNQNVRNVPLERQHYPLPSRRRKSLRTEDQRQKDRKAKTPSRHSRRNRSISKSKSFHDPQSAHDFFGFSKNDYSLDGESDNAASKVAEENGKNTKEPHVFVAPEPAAYHHDESIVKHTDEPENDTEKAVVREYRNRVATLKVSEQRQTRPNGPIHYVEFTRNI